MGCERLEGGDAGKNHHSEIYRQLPHERRGMDDVPPHGISPYLPVDVNNMKDQGVDTELQLRRIPIEETANNTLEIASLVQALGQPNTGASRVFWDKQTETRGEQSPDNEFTLVIPVNF